MRDGFRALSVEPLAGPNIKRLHGPQAGQYRYRQGDYRIVYEIVKEERKVIVLTIAQRADAYKKR